MITFIYYGIIDTLDVNKHVTIWWQIVLCSTFDKLLCYCEASLIGLQTLWSPSMRHRWDLFWIMALQCGISGALVTSEIASLFRRSGPGKWKVWRAWPMFQYLAEWDCTPYAVDCSESPEWIWWRFWKFSMQN